MCVPVCWVFVTKIYALQFTHTHKKQRESERGRASRRERESHKKQSKAIVPLVGPGNAKVLNSELTKREFRFSMHCIV